MSRKQMNRKNWIASGRRRDVRQELMVVDNVGMHYKRIWLYVKATTATPSLINLGYLVVIIFSYWYWMFLQYSRTSLLRTLVDPDIQLSGTAWSFG